MSDVESDEDSMKSIWRGPVEEDKKTILEKALKASVEELWNSFPDLNLTSDDDDDNQSKGGKKENVIDSESIEEKYSRIFEMESDEEELDEAWEKIMKNAKDAFEWYKKEGKPDPSFKQDLSSDSESESEEL